MHRNTIGSALAALAILAIAAGLSNAQSIGVNFVGGYETADPDDPDVMIPNGQTSLAAGVTAGVPEVAQANWNNVALNFDEVGSAAGLVDSSGAATGASIDWAYDTTWASTTELAPADSDRALMNGYLDATSTTDPSTISFTNLPYDAYDIYVYVGSDGNDRTGRVTVNGGGATFFQTLTADGSFNSSADYIRATAGSEAGSFASNYVKFEDISGSDVSVEVLRISNNVGAHAIQIVEELNPNPITLTVNRDTGEVTITSPTEIIDVTAMRFSSEAGNLDPAAWNRISGNLDANGDGSFDPNGDWAVTSETPNLLEEGEAFGFGEGVFTTFNAGNIWRKWYVEDISASFDFFDGLNNVTSVVTNIVYEGNGGEGFAFGDTDFDGDIDADDWRNQRDNYKNADVANAADAVESYALGDLDGDMDNDIRDLQTFKVAFNDANGPGAFEAAFGAVPEPSTVVLAAIAGLALVRRRLVKPVRLVATLLAVVVLLGAQQSFAQTGIGINFGSMDNGMDLSVTGEAGAFGNANWNNMVGNAGTDVALTDNAGNATGATVTWDSPNTWSSDGDSSGRGEDNHDGDGADGGTGALMNGYIDTTAEEGPAGDSVVTVSGIGSVIPGAVYDVYVYVNGGVAGRFGTYTIGEQSQLKTVDMPFAGTTEDLVLHEEDADGNVIVEGNYMRFEAIVGDSFELRGDATDGVRAGINGVEILQTGAEPQVLRARVDIASGTIGIVNELDSAFTIDFFELTSASGALDEDNWEPLGSGTDDGSDWETLVESGEELSQFFLLGDETLAANGGNAQAITLGSAWDGSEMDLNFRYGIAGGAVRTGIVEYGEFDFGGGGGGDNADFNGDNFVDGADQIILQRSFGVDDGGDADGDGDTDGDDQAIFDAQFGAAPPAAAASASAAPEPATVVLLALSGIAALAIRRRQSA